MKGFNLFREINNRNNQEYIQNLNDFQNNINQLEKNAPQALPELIGEGKNIIKEVEKTENQDQAIKLLKVLNDFFKKPRFLSKENGQGIFERLSQILSKEKKLYSHAQNFILIIMHAPIPLALFIIPFKPALAIPLVVGVTINFILGGAGYALFSFKLNLLQQANSNIESFSSQLGKETSKQKNF